MRVLHFELFGILWEIDLAIPIFFLIEAIILSCIILHIVKRNKSGDSNAAGKWFCLKEYVKKRIRILISGVVIYLTTLAVYYLNFNNKVLMTFFREVINFEYAVLLLLMLFCFSIFLYKNKLDMLKVARVVIMVTQIVYTYAFYICGKIWLNSLFNWVGIVLFGALFCGLYLFEPVERESEIEKGLDSPVTAYDNLFEVRKRQCDAIAAVINNHYPKGEDNTDYAKSNSICIFGEWGSGKTSLVNALINKLSNDASHPIDIIRMNITEMYTLPSMVEHFTKSLKKILKENHIYTGFNSTYKKAALALADMVTEKKLSSLFSTDRDDTYLDQLNKLNTVIKNHLEDHTVLVVVDDIERSGSTLASAALFLIKEVSIIENCVPIYLCDYDHLKEVTGFDDVFLAKFFTNQFSLVSPNLEEEIRHLINDRYPVVDEETFLSVFSDVEAKLLSADKNARKLYEERDRSSDTEKVISPLMLHDEFINRFQNTRNLIKILSQNQSYYIDLCQLQEKKRSNQKRKITNYLESVSSNYQCFILSVISVLFPKYYSYLSQGINQFFNHLDNDEDDFAVAVIEELIEDLWQKYIIKSRNDYSLVRNQDFALALVQDLKRLDELFHSESTEAMQLVQDIKAKKNLDYRLSSVIMILNSAGDQKDKALKSYLKHFNAGKRVDEIVECFTNRSLYQLTYYQDVMEIVYQTFKKVENELKKQVSVNYYHSFCSRFCSQKIHNLNCFLRVIRGSTSMDFDIDKELDLTQSAEECADRFAKAYSDTLKIEGKDGFERLKSVYYDACEQLMESGLYDEDEIKKRKDDLADTIKELKAVDKIGALVTVSSNLSLEYAVLLRESLLCYLDQWIIRINEHEISTQEYRENMATLFREIQQRYPTDKEIKEKTLQLVKKIGRISEIDGDIEKRYYVSIYPLRQKEKEPVTDENPIDIRREDESAPAPESDKEYEKKTLSDAEREIVYDAPTNCES